MCIPNLSTRLRLGLLIAYPLQHRVRDLTINMCIKEYRAHNITSATRLPSYTARDVTYLLFHQRVHWLIKVHWMGSHHWIGMVTQVRFGLRLIPLDFGSGQHQRVGSIRLKKKSRVNDIDFRQIRSQREETSGWAGSSLNLPWPKFKIKAPTQTLKVKRQKYQKGSYYLEVM